MNGPPFAFKLRVAQWRRRRHPADQKAAGRTILGSNGGGRQIQDRAVQSVAA